jgi:hypothetical protein
MIKYLYFVLLFETHLNDSAVYKAQHIKESNMAL